MTMARQPQRGTLLLPVPVTPPEKPLYSRPVYVKTLFLDGNQAIRQFAATLHVENAYLVFDRSPGVAIWRIRIYDIQEISVLADSVEIITFDHYIFIDFPSVHPVVFASAKRFVRVLLPILPDWATVHGINDQAVASNGVSKGCLRKILKMNNEENELQDAAELKPQPLFCRSVRATATSLFGGANVDLTKANFYVDEHCLIFDEDQDPIVFSCNICDIIYLTIDADCVDIITFKYYINLQFLNVEESVGMTNAEAFSHVLLSKLSRWATARTVNGLAVAPNSVL